MQKEQILAMSAGRQLDLLVHRVIFGGSGQGNAPRYSTSAWTKILDTTPLVVGRFDPSEELYNATKPFFARDRRLPAVRAATPALAACKAALIAKLEYEPQSFN